MQFHFLISQLASQQNFSLKVELNDFDMIIRVNNNFSGF